MSKINQFLDNAMHASDMLHPYEELALNQLEKLSHIEVQQLINKITDLQIHTTDASQLGALAILKRLVNDKLGL